MHKHVTLLAPLALAAFFAVPAFSQDSADKDTVVATVNGTDITVGHMIVARARLPEEYRQLPDQVLFEGMLDQLIQQTALADTFEGDLPAHVTLALDNEKRGLTASQVIDGIMSDPVDDDAIQTAYQEAYESNYDEVEFNASHILVETEEAAQAIKQELESGADFATVARENSTGPSGPGGGSLGWFGKGMMVPSFEEAVVQLEPGAISDPVQTQFGWHVIKLNEKREVEAPALEDVREELELQIRQTRAQQKIEEITAAAEVTKSAGEIDPAILKNTDLLR